MTWTPAQRRQWLRTHNAKAYYRKWNAKHRARNKAVDDAWRVKNADRVRRYHHTQIARRGDEVRQRRRIWYHKNKERILAANRKLFREKRRFLNELKAAPCTDCGHRFPPVCMDFHHARGKKRFAIGKQLNASLPTLIREIQKCDLLCANCHRMRTHLHARQRGRVLWQRRKLTA